MTMDSKSPQAMDYGDHLSGLTRVFGSRQLGEQVVRRGRYLYTGDPSDDSPPCNSGDCGDEDCAQCKHDWRTQGEGRSEPDDRKRVSRSMGTGTDHNRSPGVRPSTRQGDLTERSYNILVEFLPLDMGSEEFSDLMSTYGSTSDRRMWSEQGYRCGFVRFRRLEEAEKARDELHHRRIQDWDMKLKCYLWDCDGPGTSVSPGIGGSAEEGNDNPQVISKPSKAATGSNGITVTLRPAAIQWEKDRLRREHEERTRSDLSPVSTLAPAGRGRQAVQPSWKTDGVSAKRNHRSGPLLARSPEIPLFFQPRKRRATGLEHHWHASGEEGRVGHDRGTDSFFNPRRRKSAGQEHHLTDN